MSFGSVAQPDGGLAVRARCTAEALDRLGFDMTIVDNATDAQASDVPGRTLHVPAGSFGYSRRLRRTLRREAKEAAFVVLESAMFLPAWVFAGAGRPLVWDTNECETLHYGRLRGARNRARGAVWRGLEGWAARSSRLAVAISKAEAEAWQGLFPTLRGRIAVVDHRPFFRAVSHDDGRQELARLLGREPAPRVATFIGNTVGKQNVAAVRWIARELSPRLPPGAEVVLCGRGTEAVQAPGVVGLGFIPDVDPVIAAADLGLAPLAAGAGVKTKVLHYLALGRPVVGTSVAFEGLEGAPGTIEVPLTEMAGRVADLLAEGPPAAAGLAEWVGRRHNLGIAVEQWRVALDGAGLL